MRNWSVLLFSLFLLFTAPLLRAEPVNINTADAALLEEAIKGVGSAKAKAIVDYRDAHGPFKSVDELTLVKGVGLKTVDENRHNLTVGPRN